MEDRPEAYLKNFSRSLQDLYIASTFLESKNTEGMKEVNKEFERIISQLKLLSIIHERYVIAVAGFQGAGKTTLMKWLLFDDPDANNWLPTNLDVGENLPVLITCSNEVDKIHATLYKIDKGVNSSGDNLNINNIVEHEIDAPNEANQIVSNPQNNYIYLELIAPLPNLGQEYNNFFDNTSFLLLPGYEEIVSEMDDDKKYRQEYMRRVLPACANSIVVLDPSTIMQQDKENVLKEITDLFEGTEVTYAITHKDNTNTEDAYEKLTNEYNISKEHIIETGVKNDVFTDEEVIVWRKKLTNLLQKFSKPSNSIRKKQKRNLKRVTDDARDILNEITDYNQLVKIDTLIIKDEINSIFEKFDESVLKIRNSYRYHLEKSLSSIYEKTYNNEIKALNNKSIRQKFKDYFSDKFIKPELIQDIVNDFKNALTEVIKEIDSAYNIYLQVYNQTLSEIGIYQDLLITVENGSDPLSLKETREKSFLAKPGANYEILNLTEDEIKEVQFLIGLRDKSTDSQPTDTGREFENIMEKLPYIIFNFNRTQLMLATKQNDDTAIEKYISDNNIIEDSKTFLETFGQSTKNTTNYVKLLAGIFALDILPDGKIDVIPALFAPFFIRGEAAAVAGGKTAVAAVGGEAVTAAGGKSAAASGLLSGLAVGAAALITVYAINKGRLYYELNKRQQVDAIKTALLEVNLTEAMRSFDVTFSRVKENIYMRIKEYAYKNDEVGLSLKVNNRLQNSNRELNTLLESLKM